jgi:putative PIN family toxin of toxin-antitoxin system
LIAAVLDNPTLIAGLGWHRAPARKVVNAALAGRFAPVTSPELLAELERAMGMPELAGVFSEPIWITKLVERMSIVVEPSVAPRVVSDPAANRLLALGESADADFIVTSDISLLQVGRHRQTRIVRPR